MIVNDLHELKVNMGGNSYTYWELFRYAGDGDIFEITDAPVRDFIQKRFVMKKVEGYGTVMKKVGTYHDDSLSAVVIPHGSITGAIFKRVEQFKEIPLGLAMERIKSNKEVFLKRGGNFVSVELYTDLCDIDLDDFEDLLNAEFYIKG